MTDAAAPTLSATEAALVAAVHARRADAIDLLTQLVAEPSLLGDEAGAQNVMAQAMRASGLEVSRLAIDEAQLKAHPAYAPSLVSYDGRVNVIGAHRPARSSGRSLIFNGHIDVVPPGAAELWTRPPFSPWVDGDRLYGRGANDMKAGLAAYLIAYRAIRAVGFEPAAPVWFQSVIEEECTGNGALACLVQGYRADAAVITEPVPGIMEAQLGVMWFALQVEGVPVHASVAQTGSDAIGHAMHLVAALKRLEAHWNEPAHRHPRWCGHEHPINFNLGRISGGDWPSSVAAQCRCEVRVSYYPGRTADEVWREIDAALAAAHAASPAAQRLRYRLEPGGFQADGFALDGDLPVMQALSSCHEAVTGQQPPRITITGTTDARYFNLYGETPAICYGPYGENAHGIDEWVSLDSLMQVTAVLAVFMARWCGLQPRPTGA